MSKKKYNVWVIVFSLLGLSTMHAQEDWRLQTEKRIIQNRMSDLVIQVKNAKGEALTGVKIKAELKEHAFSFGSAINAKVIANEKYANDKDIYFKHANELFNTIVLENGHKWYLTEGSEYFAKTEKVVEWAIANKKRIRGHTMIWQTDEYGKPMGKEVYEKLKEPSDENIIEVKRLVNAHIDRIGHHYSGKIFQWDVVNEFVRWNLLTKFLTPETPHVGSPVMAEWFQAAAKAAPDAKLYLNDFHILVGLNDYDDHRKKFKEIIQKLVEQKAPLHGIGFQGHYHGKWSIVPSEVLYSRMNEFSSFGHDLMVTELDIYGKGWGETKEEIDENQAKYFEEFFMTAYSHPAMQGIMVWGFWDKRHWNKCAPFFYQDWSPKKSLAIYKDLVLNKWKTKSNGVSDEKGRFKFLGTHGTYEVVLESDKGIKRFDVELVKGGKTFDIELE